MGNNKEYQVKDHQLFISSVLHWIRLRSQNKISPKKKHLARKIFWISLLTLPFRWLQNIILFFRLPSVSLKENQPVFVIGHWRSGTTHLHYLLAQDKRFSILETFQAFLFRVAFISKAIMKPILGKLMPETRPQDNIKIDKNSPQEEDHPLTNLTEKTGMQTFYFPQNVSYFDKYNTFRDASEQEVAQWKKVYLKMLKTIALYQGKHKTLLLKNPHNTSRVKVLHELFPASKFIFIHRNPYDVYLSTKHLYDKAVTTQWLQEFSEQEVEERVLYFYEESLKTYLAYRDNLPKENLIEIGFDELDADALGTIERIYSEVSLGDFEAVKPEIEAYLETVKDYKKNAFRSVPDHILPRINKRWKFAFDEWGYEMK